MTQENMAVFLRGGDIDTEFMTPYQREMVRVAAGSDEFMATLAQLSQVHPEKFHPLAGLSLTSEWLASPQKKGSHVK